MTEDQITRERADFERTWMRIKQFTRLLRSIEYPSDYIGETQAAWEGWISRAARIPEGFVLVPREPTEAMIEASGLALSKLGPDKHMSLQLCSRGDLRAAKCITRYRAMIAASPKPGETI